MWGLCGRVYILNVVVSHVAKRIYDGVNLTVQTCFQTPVLLIMQANVECNQNGGSSYSNRDFVTTQHVDRGRLVAVTHMWGKSNGLFGPTVDLATDVG